MTTADGPATSTGQWSAEQANRWYAAQPWIVGSNFVPSTAVNNVEQWQEATFDPETIDRELGWAADLGMNACRVFLQFHVHQVDPEGHLERVRTHLELADGHGIRSVISLFDDCAFGGRLPTLGSQPDPVPGVHNSGWIGSPGGDLVVDRSRWPDLERYVRDIVGGLGHDPRVLGFDLYNEPGNFDMLAKTLPLLDAVFDWAQDVPRSQPLTVGTWNMPVWLPFDPESQARLDAIARLSVERSDLVSFHSYEPLSHLRGEVEALQRHGRPVVCTEWLMRADPRPDAPEGTLSTVDEVLPYFAAERVGSFSWGLVNGRTQTHLPWGSEPGAPEPSRWSHDLLRSDGTPYDPEERASFRSLSPR